MSPYPSQTSATDLPPELIDQISSLLGLSRDNDVARLTKRLQGFAKRYARLRTRGQLIPNPGVARKQLKDQAKLARRLLSELHGIDSVDALRRGYRTANIGTAESERASLPAFRRELEAFLKAADYAVVRTDPTPGPKSDDILFITVEALMAIFARLTGNRAKVISWQDGVSRGRFNSVEARAVGLFFGHVDPALQEHTIAKMIARVLKEREGNLLRVGHFDFIAFLEDGGEFSVEIVKAA